jgi:hypothetical protein
LKNLTAIRIWVCSLFAIGLLTLGLATQGFTGPEKCRTAAACNSIGTKAFKDGKVDEAITIFLQQAFLAELAGLKDKAVLVAYNNLALAHMRKGDDFHALAWTRLALELDGKSEVAAYHEKILRERLKEQKSKGDKTGTFQSYAGLGVWNTLVISEASDKSVHFSLEAYRVGSSGDEVNVKGEGSAEGFATLAGNDAVHVIANPYAGIDAHPCKIKMSFGELAIKVNQEGSFLDCGFGANVDASGEYWKVSN